MSASEVVRSAETKNQSSRSILHGLKATDKAYSALETY